MQSVFSLDAIVYNGTTIERRSRWEFLGRVVNVDAFSVYDDNVDVVIRFLPGNRRETMSLFAFLELVEGV